MSQPNKWISLDTCCCDLQNHNNPVYAKFRTARKKSSPHSFAGHWAHIHSYNLKRQTTRAMALFLYFTLNRGSLRSLPKFCQIKTKLTLKICLFRNGWKMLPDAARRNQTQPDATRLCQTLSDATRRYQK